MEFVELIHRDKFIQTIVGCVYTHFPGWEKPANNHYPKAQQKKRSPSSARMSAEEGQRLENGDRSQKDSDQAGIDEADANYGIILLPTK